MIYALALGTNIDHAAALVQVRTELARLGVCQYSPVYELPDRAGRAHLVYWNQAVLLTTQGFNQADVLTELAQIEQRCGRVRPSQYVRMDIDLIGAGEQISALAVVAERLPLPDDVLLPMLILWPDCPQSSSSETAQQDWLRRCDGSVVTHPILHADDALRQPLNVD